MSKQYTCSTCSKELSNRHSLSRHKKYYCDGMKVKEVNEPILETQSFQNIRKHPNDRIVYSNGRSSV